MSSDIQPLSSDDLTINLEMDVKWRSNLSDAEKQQTPFQFPPLCRAVIKNEIAVVKRLIENGAHVNEPIYLELVATQGVSEDGFLRQYYYEPTTIILIAALLRHFEIVTILLQHGADIGFIPLPNFEALRFNSLIIQSPQELRVHGMCLLHLAVISNQSWLVKHIFQFCPQLINLKCVKDETPLDKALQIGNIEIIAMLIDKGAIPGNTQMKNVLLLLLKYTDRFERLELAEIFHHYTQTNTFKHSNLNSIRITLADPIKALLLEESFIRCFCIDYDDHARSLPFFFKLKKALRLEIARFVFPIISQQILTKKWLLETNLDMKQTCSDLINQANYYHGTNYPLLFSKTIAKMQTADPEELSSRDKLEQILYHNILRYVNPKLSSTEKSILHKEKFKPIFEEIMSKYSPSYFDQKGRNKIWQELEKIKTRKKNITEMDFRKWLMLAVVPKAANTPPPSRARCCICS